MFKLIQAEAHGGGGGGGGGLDRQTETEQIDKPVCRVVNKVDHYIPLCDAERERLGGDRDTERDTQTETERESCSQS